MNEPNANTEVEKLDLSSLDVAELKRKELAELFPEVRTEGGKIDFERLKAVLGEMVDAGRERYGMNWPGKAECMRTIQAPSMGTLLPMPDESVDWDTTENVIIEGDNLEVLKLLQKSYLSKIKMIYIDPPYNTGNDFIYPDNYTESLQTYLEYTGQVDDEGRKFGVNADSDGRFHSKWLNMMYPRIFLARNLLSDDGVMFISIDDREVASLRHLMDHMFGAENFIAQVTVETDARARQYGALAITHEYLVGYAKNESFGFNALSDANKKFKFEDDEGGFDIYELRNRNISFNRQNRPNLYYPFFVDPIQPDKNGFYKVSVEPIDGWIETYPLESQGVQTVWRWSKERAKKELGALFAKKNEVGAFQVYKKYRGTTYVHSSVWTDKEIRSDRGTLEVKALFENERVFDHPKPVGLVERLLSVFVEDGDTVLDFFAGSGTTGHAVLARNADDGGKRKFVLVQLPEPTDLPRHPSIASITRDRLRRAANVLSKKQLTLQYLGGTIDLGFRAFALAPSNFVPWDGTASNDAEQLAKQLKLGIDHTRGDRTPQDLLFEVLLKSWGEPALSLKVGEETIEGVRVFSIADGAFLICLEEKVSLEFIRALAARKPDRVVMRESAFAGNDQLKTNAVQTFKSQGVTSFKVV